MARQWHLPGAGVIDESGTDDWHVPGAGVLAEDQADVVEGHGRLLSDERNRLVVN